MILMPKTLIMFQDFKMYQSNKIKQAQIFFFLTIAMMAFWMYVATGYTL